MSNWIDELNNLAADFIGNANRLGVSLDLRNLPPTFWADKIHDHVGGDW